MFTSAYRMFNIFQLSVEIVLALHDMEGLTRVHADHESAPSGPYFHRLLSAVCHFFDPS